MSQQEFDGYMTGAVTSVSAWESALVACESMHQLCEHLSILKGLSERTANVRKGTAELQEDILKFKVCTLFKIVLYLFFSRRIYIEVK